jgi:hypothetical protein
VAKTSIASARKILVRPIARYSPYDSVPRDIRILDRHTAAAVVKAGGVRRSVARRLTIAARRGPLRSAAQLAALGLSIRDVRLLTGACLFQDDPRVAIRDVQPARGRIMSGRPFRLEISFAVAVKCTGFLRIVVEWAGLPFTVERVLSAKEMAKGKVSVAFSARRSLPVGPATFHASLYTDRGSQTSFRVTCAVLPSNPFSLSVSPRDNFVTGSFSARAVRQGSSFVTVIGVTLSNGNPTAVSMQNGFNWEFWDGPIGSGTRVEQGAGSFGGSITVTAFGTWSGWIAFSSPSGSGIFNKLNGKEDLAVRITMTRSNGATVFGDLTVRTMFRFGLNITRVGAEGFSAADYTKLYQAVDATRNIYERRDVSFDVDRRNITNAQAGGFLVITSESEARDVFEQWSGPDNNFIDVFVVHSISGTGFDGLAGDIPGPTSHSGRKSGVIVDKSGLNVPYLGMLIGHEVGHYLGLSHVTDAGNLMLSSSGASDTNLNYDPQYRKIIRHGWVSIS